MTDTASISGKPLPSSRIAAASELQCRISAAVEKLATAKLAADAIGVSEDTIARWRQSASKPPFPGIVALCRAANIHVEWMASGEGPRDIQPEGALSLVRTEGEQMGRAIPRGTILDEAADDAIALPRLSIEGSAGHGLIPTREEIEDYLSVSRTYLREVGINPIAAHVLRLSGHSMAPTLQDKDLVIVDTSQTTIRDE